MKKEPAASSSLSISPVTAIAITVLLAAIRLYELVPITPPPGGSLQNWRVELATSLVLVIGSIWLLKNWRAGSEKLSVFGKYIAVTMWCLAGFVVWSALSFLWASSSASVLLHTLTWAAYITALMLSLIVIRTRGGLSAIANAFLLTSTVAAAVCLYDNYAMTDATRQITTIRIKYARFAESFVAIAPLLCAWTFYARRKVAVFAFAGGWLLCWLVAVLSASKGAFIAGIIGHVAFFLGCLIFTKYPIRKKLLGLAAVWLAFTLITQAAIAALTPIPTATAYISGEADPTRETSMMRIFTWQVGLQMFADHPVIGVGANNFGIDFNNARIEYFKQRPEENSPDVAEWYTVERAHNEFLQILSELGIVGALMFVGAFAAFGILFIRRVLTGSYSFSPLFWASIAGMTGFFASSFVSSFSFRIAQNGVFFFVIFALGINELAKGEKVAESRVTNWIRPVLSTAVLGTFGLAVLIGCKAYSNHLIGKAAVVNEISRAMPYFSTAIWLDPDNIHVYQRVADRYAHQGLHGDAAKNMRSVIERGGGTTLNYVVLADLHAEAREFGPADRAFAEAVAIYPTSVFLRASYAVYLDGRNQTAEADEQMARAAMMDQGQANGWYSLLTRIKDEAPRRQLTGPVAAEDDLLPNSAKSFYMKKAEIEMQRRNQYLTPMKR